MFTTLAKVRIADAQRFIDVFSTHGLAKRRAHGAYFSDRSRLFQADRSRRFILIVADEGPHA
jgi:hypothetical protein